MAEIYAPDSYFDRVDGLYAGQNLDIDRAWRAVAATMPWRWRRQRLRYLIEAFGLMARIALRVPERDLRRLYLRRFWHFLRLRREPSILRVYAIKCAWHYHMQALARRLQTGERDLLNTY
jgi:hypothetical protein